MLFTRQRSEAAAAAARAPSSSPPNRWSEHGASNPPTKKLRSLTSRTSRFIANPAPAAPAARTSPARAPAQAPARAPRAPRAPAAPARAARARAAPVAAAAVGLALKKSSRFRGVTKHRVTARFEAHLWDKGAYNNKQQKKGRQVYLGAYDDEISAAQAYDLAALKYWGPTTVINFQVENYTQQLKEMKDTSRLEFLAGLRRRSSGFSRGLSKFRGVARHHQNGRWEARIGRVEGNKYLYLGTYGTQEEAAEAYDKAAIKYRGTTAVTNFELSRYPKEVEAAERTKNKTSKNSFKDNQMSKAIEEHLPSDLQTIKKVMQSLDGGQNLSTTNTVTTPCLEANLDVVTLDMPHTSKLLKDGCQPQQEKEIMQFEDPTFAGVGEESGLNNTTLKNVKQEEEFDHPAVPKDLNLDLGYDYEEVLVGFDFSSASDFSGTSGYSSLNPMGDKYLFF